MAPDKKLQKLRDDLCTGRFRTSKYTIFKVYEPKEREIYMLPLYPDHIVHHAIINILGPIWQSMFVADSFACIPGRGIHSASARCMKFVRKYKYVLQCDISKFYPSINHDVMMRIISRKISDRRMLRLLDDIVRSLPPPTGLPIGNLTSQWMGNLYMHDLDMFVKHALRVKNYIRYCDDFCIFSDDRRELIQYRNQIEEYLRDTLKLRFSKSFIKPTAVGVNFIGYRHFKKYVTLTRAGAAKMRRRMRTMANAQEISPHARGQLAAFNGWMRWACGYNMRWAFYRQMRARTRPAFARFFKKYFVDPA